MHYLAIINSFIFYAFNFLYKRDKPCYAVYNGYFGVLFKEVKRVKRAGHTSSGNREKERKLPGHAAQIGAPARHGTEIQIYIRGVRLGALLFQLSRASKTLTGME